MPPSQAPLPRIETARAPRSRTSLPQRTVPVRLVQRRVSVPCLASALRCAMAQSPWQRWGWGHVWHWMAPCDWRVAVGGGAAPGAWWRAGDALVPTTPEVVAPPFLDCGFFFRGEGVRGIPREFRDAVPLPADRGTTAASIGLPPAGCVRGGAGGGG